MGKELDQENPNSNASAPAQEVPPHNGDGNQPQPHNGDRLSTPDIRRGPGETGSAGNGGELREGTGKAMKPWIHRALVAWLCVVGIVSAYTLITFWPSERGGGVGTVEQAPDSAVAISNAASRDTSGTGRGAELQNPAATRNGGTLAATPGGIPADSTPSPRVMFILVLCAGLLGGSAHGLSSIMDFRGQGRLFESWSLWYFGLPLLGGVIAMLSFIVFTAGFGDAIGSLKAADPFKITAIGVLAGLFTDKMTTKLSEVLDALFALRKERSGELSPAGSSEPKPKKQP